MIWETRLRLLRNNFATVNIAKLRRVFPHLESHIGRLGAIQGHVYQDKALVATALLHRSALVYWPTDKSGIFSNERLEFLGDAFLNFFVASEAMLLQPSLQEGELSKLRSLIVGTENLAHKSRELGIGECLLVGKAELNPTSQNRANMLADTFEAVTAALLIDAGEQKVRTWLSGIFADDLMLRQEALLNFDAKGKVQQWVQSIVSVPPVYKTIGTEGVPQETLFIVACFIGKVEIARATGKSKREASKKVAEKILHMIEQGKLTRNEVLKDA